MNNVAAEYLSNPEYEPSAKPAQKTPSADVPLRPGDYEIGKDESVDTTNPQRDGGWKAEAAEERPNQRQSCPCCKFSVWARF